MPSCRAAGSAASESFAVGPQIPMTHMARPPIMPNPQDISIGPSEFNAEPNENLLVKKWKPKTASSTTPKITQVVGCVNAAVTDNRNTADRAPHDVRDGPRNGSSAQRRKSIMVLSRYPTYGVVRNSAAATNIESRTIIGSRRLR